MADNDPKSPITTSLAGATTHPERAYNLGDSIALRNALRCT